MKQKRNDLNQSIEQLENDYWGNAPSDSSFTIKRVYSLRTKKIEDLDVEDLRLLINQNIGLLHIIPLALALLKKDIMSEGDYYEGDLLFAVLTLSDDFWREHQAEASLLKEIYAYQNSLVEAFDIADNIKQELRNAHDAFLAKHFKTED